MAPENKNPEYNWIYERLVADENDLIGAIAYILYKQHKIEFIKKIEAEYSTSPTPDQWLEFHRTTCLESNIINYQKRAEDLVSQFLKNMLSEHVEHLEAQADQRMAARVELITGSLREKIAELENSINGNHILVQAEITNKKSILNRLGEAFLNILYGLAIIAIIGGVFNGYKWVSKMNSHAEKVSGIN
ncbi:MULTISPECIES: hypothetical protein [Acinetobacter]|uniref:hypothetical protein n=1 Tax=Acinetobacter TaxID=469 RepID=UPI00029C8A50|nr:MULTISPECIES: hypothetical protein [Acinetobacter]EKU38130.1 hypothetical protein ACINWC141_1107 [Acinetobacter sp. WC-141]MBM7141199.1 hypothetical protein [Acinetobacter sp. 105-3]